MLTAPRITKHDRIMGGLVGLIIGDALGVPVEFSSRQERIQDPVRGRRAYGTHCQPRGSWSDDGSMALAHVDSFLKYGWDPDQHMAAFCRWWEQGSYTSHQLAFDIGSTTRLALLRFLAGTPALLAGGRKEWDNGNGSIMRAIPAACWWGSKTSEQRIAKMQQVSAMTHRHIRSQLSCAFLGELAAGLLIGRPLPEVMRQAGKHLQSLVSADDRHYFDALFDASCLDCPPEDVPNNSHVTATLKAAAWCLHQHDDYGNAVLAAVNLGGDTDTIAAIVGGLAGIRCGFSDLPHAWVSSIGRSSWLVDLSENFATACLTANTDDDTPCVSILDRAC